MKKILIVDELPSFRELFSFALKHRGYEVLVAEDGISAIDSIKKHSPHLVILEAHLPHMDGLTVLRIVRSIPEFKNLPILMLTTVEERQTIVQAVQIGIQGYILKSQFSLDIMLGRIEKLIGIPSSRIASSSIAEVWDDIDAPTPASSHPSEIPGDIEDAVALPKPH